MALKNKATPIDGLNNSYTKAQSDVTASGNKGLVNNGGDRTAKAVRAMVQSRGGRSGTALPSHGPAQTQAQSSVPGVSGRAAQRSVKATGGGLNRRRVVK